MTQEAPLIRQSGLALMGAGVLVIIVNAVITPLLPRGVPFSDVAASTAFVWRQSLAAVAAALLMFGAIGLYLRQADRTGWFGAFAFATALVGSALLLATEWLQLFEVRDVALRAPETLNRLDAAGVGLDDIGAMAAMAVFVAGWIALAVSSRRSGLFPRHATTLVIAGLFATPFLSAVLPSLLAGAIGNAILGAGWMWLGWDMWRSKTAVIASHLPY